MLKCADMQQDKMRFRDYVKLQWLPQIGHRLRSSQFLPIIAYCCNISMFRPSLRVMCEGQQHALPGNERPTTMHFMRLRDPDSRTLRIITGTTPSKGVCTCGQKSHRLDQGRFYMKLHIHTPDPRKLNSYRLGLRIPAWCPYTVCHCCHPI